MSRCWLLVVVDYVFARSLVRAALVKGFANGFGSRFGFFWRRGARG